MQNYVPVRCPVCGKRLHDMKESDVVEVRKFTVGDEPDVMRKCPKCKSEIGITIQKIA